MSKGREYGRRFEFSSGKFCIGFVIEDAQDATAAMDLRGMHGTESVSKSALPLAWLLPIASYCLFVTSLENNDLCEVICN